MSDMNDVIGRAIADKAFRAELLKDPSAANSKYDLGLTDDQIATVDKLDSDAIEASLGKGDTDLSAE